MWSEFLDSATVHGFTYIHRRNPICDRILWGLVIVFGFSTSCFLIHKAFYAWDENPVLITLDTIAAPIHEIAFPTVTACRDEYAVPNSWAYLETVLNMIHFSCTYNLLHETEFNCEKTKKVREDFKFQMEKILKFLKGFVFQDKLGNGFFQIHDQTKIKFMVKSVELLNNKSLTMNQIKDFPMDYFFDMKPIEDILKPYGVDITLQYGEFFLTDDCKDGRCDFIGRIINLVDLVQKDVPFGTFLAHTVAIGGEKQFKSFVQDKFLPTKGDDLCHFQSKELFLQEYLTSLGDQIGLNVSLYDVPSILAKYSEPMLLNMTYNQVSLYTKCLINNDLKGTLVNECKNQWQIVFEPASNYHPCNKKEFKICCSGEKLDSNIGSVMKIMRLAHGRGQSAINLEEVVRPFLDSSKLTYPVWGNAFEEVVLDNHTFIPRCKKGSALTSNPPFWYYHGTDSCLLFEPVVTDLGICQAHNAAWTTEFLQESPFKDAFKDAYKTDLQINKTLDYGEGAGIDHQLEFYLFANNIRQDSLPKEEYFQIGITSDSEYFMLKSIAKKVKIGYRTSFKIQPMEIYPDDNIDDIPIELRNCRFPCETEGTVERFKVYSQSVCQMECNLNMAQERCKCLPWFYPPNPRERNPIICDGYGNFCFDYLFKNPPKDHKCSCLPSCKDIQYAINEHTEKLDPEALCNTRYTVEFWLGYWIYNAMGDFIFSYNRMKKNQLDMDSEILKSDIERELCKNLVQNDLAIVSVTFETEKFVRTIKSRKVSFVDKLATLGGTLGLFTGMSLLSMVEIAFWFCKGIRQIVGKLKTKKNCSQA